MSSNKDAQRPSHVEGPAPRPLTPSQKDAARRTGLTEEEFSRNTEKLIQAGRIKRGDIPQ